MEVSIQIATATKYADDFAGQGSERSAKVTRVRVLHLFEFTPDLLMNGTFSVYWSTACSTENYTA